MNRSKWQNVLVRFQASARGYLVRNEVRRARKDFEDIVEEIDGGLSHLQWRHTVICIPHFTDTHGPLVRTSSSTSSPPAPGPDEAACLPGDQHTLLEKTEAERDESQTKERGCDSGARSYSKHGEDGERQQMGDNDGGAMESFGESTSVWSSLNLDMNCGHSQKGSQEFCLASEVSRTSEALCVHKNTLIMELVWLQQAIDSRKKYLSLRDRLSMS